MRVIVSPQAHVLSASDTSISTRYRGKVGGNRRRPSAARRGVRMRPGLARPFSSSSSIAR
jgi:hypothetical protein